MFGRLRVGLYVRRRRQWRWEWWWQTPLASGSIWYLLLIDFQNHQKVKHRNIYSGWLIWLPEICCAQFNEIVSTTNQHENRRKFFFLLLFLHCSLHCEFKRSELKAKWKVFAFNKQEQLNYGAKILEIIITKDKWVEPRTNVHTRQHIQLSRCGEHGCVSCLKRKWHSIVSFIIWYCCYCSSLSFAYRVYNANWAIKIGLNKVRHFMINTVSFLENILTNQKYLIVYHLLIFSVLLLLTTNHHIVVVVRMQTLCFINPFFTGSLILISKLFKF